MKKALSLLLVLCMLATLCTVPVFAEDETLDLPLIEEVTEKEKKFIINNIFNFFIFLKTL